MFCIYEHWRPDKNECFYVGKGKLKNGKFYRAFDLFSGRNRMHRAVVLKLARNGFVVDIRIVYETDVEDMAYAKEIELIAHWRSLGVRLTNVADGGGRNSGWKLSPKRLKALVELNRGKQYRLGAVLSDETKEKISRAHIGKTYSDEYKARMSIACAGEKNGFFGKTHTAATRAKVAESNRRRVWSAESKIKLSSTLNGRQGHKKSGWTWSAESREIGRIAAAKRWKLRRAQSAACGS